MVKSIGTGGIIFIIAFLTLLAVWLFANNAYRKHMSKAETAWSNIVNTVAPLNLTYSSKMVADLPEIAQRYFNHAIASGTPLSRTVELEMEGDFRLGTKEKSQTYAMTARQILHAPFELVWLAKMKRGPIRISGTDGLHKSHGWNRFWMFKSIPLVQAGASPDLDRAAAARPAVESVWAPATLLPQNGTEWTQLGPNTAKVLFYDTPNQTEITLTLAPSGQVQEIVTQRWSDLGTEKAHQLYPFGGAVSGEETFSGFTIPSQVDVGYHIGTDKFFAFFSARITSAKFL